MTRVVTKVTLPMHAALLSYHSERPLPGRWSASAWLPPARTAALPPSSQASLTVSVGSLGSPGSHGYTNQHAFNFPETLYAVLALPASQHILAWLPDGKRFAIRDKALFVSQILPRHFDNAKYSSFTRRLKRWNFERVTVYPDLLSTHHHRYFLRDRPDLVRRMAYGTDHGEQLTTESDEGWKDGEKTPTGNCAGRLRLAYDDAMCSALREHQRRQGTRPPAIHGLPGCVTDGDLRARCADDGGRGDRDGLRENTTASCGALPRRPTLDALQTDHRRHVAEQRRLTQKMLALGRAHREILVATAGEQRSGLPATLEQLLARHQQRKATWHARAGGKPGEEGKQETAARMVPLTSGGTLGLRPLKKRGSRPSAA